MKQEYYCDIPWRQIWKEDDKWYQEQKGFPTFKEEKSNIRAICTETIPWPLPWTRIWKNIEEWNEKNKYSGWDKQKRKIQQLIQTAANKAVNKTP
jgi:hypothetical protein